MRSERSISSLMFPHLEHLFVEGNQRSARSNVSPSHAVLYPICRRNSPRPTSLIERAGLRLRFMPATWRSSSTTTAGRRSASETCASRRRRLTCFTLTRFAMFSGNGGGSTGLDRLPFLPLTLVFGSARKQRSQLYGQRVLPGSGERG